jgi:hypothetical protein
MALTDNIFSSIPGPLISQFGISATYIKASQNQTYNPNTGIVSGSSTEIPVKIIITELKPEEMQGFYQQTDVKILISADSLPGYFPQTTDSVKYLQNGTARTAKIIGMFSYRGDSAIMHSVVARLS